MKKGVALLFIALFLSVFLIGIVNFVSADEVSDQISRGVSSTVSGLSNGFIDALQSIHISVPNLSRLLLGLLLWMIMYNIVGSFFDHREFGGFNLITAAVSLIITVLSFILIPDNFINVILLQYGAMGAAILSFIPFAIMLWFTINLPSLLLARIVWIFYVFYYLALFAYAAGTTTSTADSNIYGLALFLGVVIFFGIKSLRKLMSRGKLDSFEEKAIRDIQFRKLGRKLEDKETAARIDVPDLPALRQKSTL